MRRKKRLLGKTNKVHFIGIGGIGMSGIAELLLNLGFEVTGSDILESPIIDHLKSLGAKIKIGHSPENVLGADVVVYSSAIKPDNVEIVSAQEKLIPVIRRAELLAELMRMKYGIAVAGSHGKTTTTSMIAEILSFNELDPTVINGGIVKAWKSIAKLGEGDFLVAEADESDRSFLLLSPTIAVITNIDNDHMDHYKNFEELKSAFISFANRVPFYGVVILCLDDDQAASLIPHIKRRILTYGLTPQADFSASEVKINEFTTTFKLFHRGEEINTISLNLIGEHNIRNSLAAISVGWELDLPFEKSLSALSSFKGVARRFDLKAKIDDILVIDDYGHHPSEIKATLSSAKQAFKRRLLVVFQPHRFTRTHLLFNEFTSAFYNADLLFIMDIYPASEPPIPGVDSAALAQAIHLHGHKSVTYTGDAKTTLEAIKKAVKPGDILLTLGAGPCDKVADQFIREWKGC